MLNTKKERKERENIIAKKKKKGVKCSKCNKLMMDGFIHTL